jgi:CRISPR-associated protein Csd1
VRVDKYGVSPDRAALIKLVLNRNNKGGGCMVTENGIQGEAPVAYICGQIFSKMERMQYAALGDRNAGIRERYFTYAMTAPSAAFGRLFDLYGKHYKKVKNEKAGLAVTIDRELQDLCKGIDIARFPAAFSLEERGYFAIGYYHQRQQDFCKKSKNNENKEGK